MPEPVMGGAPLLMFGTVAAAGIRIIASQRIDRKATLVMALSFSFGLSVELVPDILCQLPETVKNIFSSGITTGGLTAILANLLIRIKEQAGLHIKETSRMNRMCPCIHPGCFCLLRRECRITRTCFVPDCIQNRLLSDG